MMLLLQMLQRMFRGQNSLHPRKNPMLLLKRILLLILYRNRNQPQQSPNIVDSFFAAKSLNKNQESQRTSKALYFLVENFFMWLCRFFFPTYASRYICYVVLRRNRTNHLC